MLTYLRNNKKEIYLLLAVFVVFLTLRLPGVHLPYHQDEYKSAIATEQGSEAAGNFFAHPPLTQFIFHAAYDFFGGENLRLFPIVFSSLSFFLLYYYLRKRAGQKTALIGVSLFTLCIYSVWGSLQLDTDGAVIPFFFLLALCVYEHAKDCWSTQRRYVWLGALALVCLLGFLVKLSFILVVGAIIADFLLEHRHKVSKKHVLYGGVGVIVFLLISVFLIFIINHIYPAFRIDSMIKHALYFAHFSGRDYVQVIIQGSKALFYLSPLLLLPPLLISKDIFKKTRIQFLYIILGLIFYLILLDFSHGALDKYFGYLILPLCSISASVISVYSQSFSFKKYRGPVILAGVTGLIVLFLNFFPHDVVPLYPKTDWFGKVFSLRWNFLNPFMGGSGPLGFYVSFLMIALAFITSAAAVIAGFIRKQWKEGMLLVLIAVGCVYNVVFIEELLFGKINGSSKEVLEESLGFISSSSSIKSVITYNDSGAYELHHMEKYKARFYAVPAFGDAHKPLFEEHNGYFLVVGIPLISPHFFHGQFFTGCDTVYQSTSGKITAYVYDCKK
ncbi:MAG: glycosyltransferase family 39 protein [Patescibacteria group bacterium]